MRKALTIGELLVTMSIIGVIAALVLPSFMKDYHKKIYTSKLKKTYEILENAINQACTDNNVSYLAQTQYSKTGKANQQEFLNKYFKKASANATFPFAATYKVINTGASGGSGIESDSAYAKLASGEAIALSCSPYTYNGTTKQECIISVDINSTDGPNIGGRDFFRFRIDTTNNKIMSHNTSSDCGNDQYGHGCFTKILENNWTMDY